MRKKYSTEEERRLARTEQHRAWWRRNGHRWREYNNRYNREYRKKNASRIANNKRRTRLQKEYGMSLADFETLLKEQKDRCLICNRRFSSKLRPVVDHDHKTGKVRGILCDRCNVGLGKFEDDKQLLAQAGIYLEQHS